MAASSDRELQRLLNKDPTVWTVSEVGMWLSAVGLEAYKIQFLSEGISGTELFELDTDDLPVLGITSSGQQKRFWAELRNLKNKPKLSRSPSARTTGSSDSSGSGIATSGATSSSSSSSAAASASASSAAELAVKFVYRGKSYKRMVPVDSSVSEVRHIAKRLFGKTVSLNFRDGDGDTIPLRRDADWRYAKKATGDRLMTLNCSRRTRTTQAKRSETDALKHLKDPVIIIDANGVINFFNHAAEQFFGWPASSIIGSKVNMLMPDDFAENHDRYMQNYLTTGVAKIIGKGRQVRALLRNGKSVDIFLTVRETSTRKGRHFVGTIQESSADVVQVDQTSHFTILQSILDPAVVISDKGIVQYLNPAACTLFGYSPTQVVGKNVKMLMQGKDKREHDEYIRRYLETGQATVLGKGREVVGVNSRGELIPIHLSVTEQKLSNQSIFTGMCREIQRRDDSAVETETVLAKTRTVLEDLLVASVVINDAGIIQYLNPACEDLLSIRLTDAIGRNVAILMPEEHARHHDEYLRKWRETGVENVFGVGRSLIAKNFSTGAAIPVRLSVSKRLDETKRYICIGALIPE